MANQYIWIGISIAIFFAGFAGGYVISEQTYSPANLMAKDPQTTTQWMETMMGTMMNDPDLRNEMMTMIMQNPEMMQAMMQNQQMMEGTMGSGMMMGSNPIEQHERMLELMGTMMDNEDIMNHMFAHMIENERIVHQMFTLMDTSPALKEHMAAHVSGDLSEYEHLDDMHNEEEHGHEDGRQ